MTIHLYSSNTGAVLWDCACLQNPSPGVSCWPHSFHVVRFAMNPILCATCCAPGILAYNEYGSWPIMKAIGWICGAIVSTLIVASRKHYTVDIVIAWYTVPLVFYMLYRRWTTVRPMSEFLGAIGEFDEPDPSDTDIDQVRNEQRLLRFFLIS